MAAPMTPSELRSIIDRLGWSQADLAHCAKRDLARIHKQARGANPIDDDLAVWLRAFASLLDQPPIKKPQGASDVGTGDHLPAARQPFAC